MWQAFVWEIEDAVSQKPFEPWRAQLKVGDRLDVMDNDAEERNEAI